MTSLILRPDRLQHVDETFGSLDVDLNPEDKEELDEVSQWTPISMYLA